MSTVTLNLQDCVATTTTTSTASAASPSSSSLLTLSTKLTNNSLSNAPLVKISLTPENTGRSEMSSTSTSTSSLSSPITPYTRVNTQISTFLQASTAATSQSVGSATKQFQQQGTALSTPISPSSHVPLTSSLNSSGNQTNPHMISSPGSKPMLMAATLTCSVKTHKNFENEEQQQSQQQHQQSSSLIQINSQSSQLIAIAALQKQLEQQARENLELRDKLQRETSKNQMVISENLLIREELKKAQTKLRQYEQLNSMRYRKSSLAPSTIPHMRLSGQQRNSHHLNQFHSTNQNNNNIITQKQTSTSIDQLSTETPLIFNGNHVVFAEEHDQLSQLSILDILENLNNQDDAIIQARRDDRRQSFVQMAAEKDENNNEYEMPSRHINNNIKSKFNSHYTPKALKRVEAFQNNKKKSFI